LCCAAAHATTYAATAAFACVVLLLLLLLMLLLMLLPCSSYCCCWLSYQAAAAGYPTKLLLLLSWQVSGGKRVISFDVVSSNEFWKPDDVLGRATLDVNDLAFEPEEVGGNGCSRVRIDNDHQQQLPE
jgi:hypothetical protein